MVSITWQYVQENANQILADGVYQLLNAEDVPLDTVSYSGYGNYLIFYQTIPVYIGESQNIKSRIRQHASIKRSTFYKNYLKSDQLNIGLPEYLQITDFHCHYIKTLIGRKEVEEFGIVNIPTSLNRFQLNKSAVYSITPHNFLWQLSKRKNQL